MVPAEGFGSVNESVPDATCEVFTCVVKSPDALVSRYISNSIRSVRELASVFVVGAVQETTIVRLVTVAETPEGAEGASDSLVVMMPNVEKWSTEPVTVMWSTLLNVASGATCTPLEFS